MIEFNIDRPALVPDLQHGLIGLTKIWQNK